MNPAPNHQNRECCPDCLEWIPNEDAESGEGSQVEYERICNDEKCPCHKEAPAPQTPKQNTWEEGFQATLKNRMRMNNDALLRNEIPWIMDFIRTQIERAIEETSTTCFDYFCKQEDVRKEERARIQKILEGMKLDCPDTKTAQIRNKLIDEILSKVCV